MVPDFIKETEDKDRVLDNPTLKEKQELFFKENGTQLEFEARLLQFQELRKC
ncbi:hypothetical protein AAAC51_44545 [Priestia megaterium]